MAARKQGETTWFTDTGVSNHVTPNINILSIHSEYVGNDSLAVRSDEGLSFSLTLALINNIGSSHDNLHMLAISQNLLSVS